MSSNPFSVPAHLKKLWILLFLLVINACASVPGMSPEPVSPKDPESIAFQEAEDLLQQGALDQALAGYSGYLGRFPQGRHAAASLQRIGTIYETQGSPDAAEAFYKSAIAQFPDAPAAGRARLALLNLLIDQGRSEEAAEMAPSVLEGPLDETDRHALWRRLALLYRDTDNSALAVWYAFLLYKELAEPEKRQWESEIKEAVARLEGDDIQTLWDRIDDRWIRGYLMYRHAVVQMMDDNYDDAFELLTAFQQSYPDHPHAADAQNLMPTLIRKLSFSPYTLGCLLPLTGSFQVYGQRVLNAIELALSLDRGGESPQPIKLVIEDTGSEDARAVQAVRKLARSGVGAIIGPINAAPAAAREAQKLNIPILTLTQKMDITDIGDFVFRHFITPRAQVSTLVDYFINDIGVRNFAVMYPKEIYGDTFMTLFWDEAVRQGGRIVGVESYTPGQTDFAETIKKLVGNYYTVPPELQVKPLVQVEDSPYYRSKAESPDRLETWLPDPVTRLAGLFYQDPDQDRVRGPAIGRRPREDNEKPIVDFDVLFIPEAPQTAGLILPQLAFYDIRNIYAVGTNLWHSPQLIDMARKYAQNAVMVDGFYRDSESRVVRNFVETYRSVYDTDPGIIEAFAFDAAEMLLDLLSRPDIQLRHDLRNQLKQMVRTDGVTGETAFAENGEPIKKLTLLRIKGDQFIEIRR